VIPGRGRRGDDGFTLLELVIALSVLAVAIGGLFSVFGAALRTTAVDVHRVDGAALAAEQLAVLRRTPYGSLRPQPPTSMLPTPTINGQLYAISTAVAWAGSGTGWTPTALPQAYKLATVDVTWTDQAGTHVVGESTDLYPGGLGPYGGSRGPDPPPRSLAGCTPLSPPPAPPGPIVAALPDGDPAVAVSWTEPPPSGGTPVDHWGVATSPDGATWTTAAMSEPVLVPGAAHVVEVGGLDANVRYFAKVLVFGACGDPSSSWPVRSGPATAPMPGGTGCALASVSTSAPVAQRGADGGLSTDVTVEGVVPAGGCGPLWAGVQASNGVVSEVALLPSGSTGSFVGALGATGPWDLGRHTVEVFTGPPRDPLPSTSAVATVQLCVEQSGAPGC